MSYIFKKRNIYYLCVKYKGKRVRKSLGTSNKTIANRLSKDLEQDILTKIILGRSVKRFTCDDIPELIEKFMSFEHNWRPRTREVYETCFKHYLDKGLPETQTYKAMVIRCLNRLQNWAFQEGFIDRPRLIPGGNNYVQRNPFPESILVPNTNGTFSARKYLLITEHHSVGRKLFGCVSAVSCFVGKCSK